MFARATGIKRMRLMLVEVTWTVCWSRAGRDHLTVFAFFQTKVRELKMRAEEAGAERIVGPKACTRLFAMSDGSVATGLTGVGHVPPARLDWVPVKWISDQMIGTPWI